MQVKTQLEDRILWADGTNEIDPAKLNEFILKFIKTGTQGELAHLVSVSSITPEIKSYNQLVDHPITTKTSLIKKFPPDWNLPESYKYFDVDSYLMKLADKIVVDELYEERIKRLSHEIWLFKKLKLDDILKVLIYMIDTFKKKKIVWGVGRGSSCSSYILYLMELHEVDPVFYGIDITDFLKIT